MSFLDDLPLATLATIVGWVLTVIAYLNNDISVEVALGIFGLTPLGAGALGMARNGAGRGLRK